MSKALPLILAAGFAGTAGYLTMRPHALSLAGPATPALHKKEIPPSKAGTARIAPAADVPVPPRDWPQAKSDIPADSKAVFGTLENGFRYIIYPNSEPPLRVSLRLHIAAGSLMEAEDQQGLAHFLEHMVFNGSKNFKADELVPAMQHLGIGFGAHVNAFTSFDQTVYMLDLPDVSPKTMDLCFGVVRDFGDGALLAEEEIDRERGVILSEKTSRDSVADRIMEKQFLKLLPKSLVAKRFPIGQPEVIQKAQRERFVDFYQHYYVPERMTFIVVGDVKTQEIEARIKAQFSSMKNPPVPRKNPDLGPLAPTQGLETFVFSDKEIDSTSLGLTLLRPHEDKPDNRKNRTEKLPLDIAQAVLSRRFQFLAQQPNSPILAGTASDSSLFNYVDLGSIDVTVTDDKWEQAVPVLEQEFRRVVQYGFTDSEISEEKAVILNAYLQALKTDVTRPSDALATDLTASINEDDVFSTAQTNLEIAQKALATIDAKTCHEAFKKFWDAPGLQLVLTTKDQKDGDEKSLAAAYQESTGKPIDAKKPQAMPAFGYADFGKAGEIASRKEVSDLGITQLVLSNEIRVNLKPTAFQKDRILLLARISGGKLTQPKDSPMLDSFASSIYNGGGLGKHSNDDLTKILAGKNVETTFAVGEDSFLFSGGASSGDFKLEMQLLAAGLTDPGYRKEGLWQFQKAIPMIYQKLRHTSAGPEAEMFSWLYGNDFRYSTAPQDKLLSYTIADAKSWLTPALKHNYLELSIVGDFEIERILPDVLATVGALPARASSPLPLEETRKISQPSPPAEKSFTYDSKIPQGSAAALWKVNGFRNNQKEFRRINILAAIYTDRLRKEIREKLGASYSPSSNAFGSEALENVGYLMGQSVGKPEDIPLLLKTMRELAEELSKTGATEDEFARALQPILKQMESSRRENGYWLGTVLSRCQAEPKLLDLARNRSSDYSSITLEEINALARKYLIPSNSLLIGIQPKE